MTVTVAAVVAYAISVHIDLLAYYDSRACYASGTSVGTDYCQPFTFDYPLYFHVTPSSLHQNAQYYSCRSDEYDLYDSRDFWGYSAKNASQVLYPAAQVGAQLLYSECLANSTCAAMAAKAHAPPSAFWKQTNSSASAVLALLRANPKQVYCPQYSWSTPLMSNTYLHIADTSMEAIGMHNWLIAAYHYRNPIDLALYDRALRLKSVLQGAATANEMLIHTMILSAYYDTHATAAPKAVKPARGPYDALAPPFRSVASQRAALQHAQLAASLASSCSSQTEINNFLDQLNVVDNLCLAFSLVTNIGGAISSAFGNMAIRELNPVIAQALKTVDQALLEGVISLCSKADSGCASLSQASWENVSLGLSLLGTALALVEGEVAFPITLYCTLVSVAGHVFGNAAKCCATDCSSPQCVAGGILCAADYFAGC